MRLWVLSGKVLLALGSVALGLIIYWMSPAARAVSVPYWAAIVTYIVAAEVAWYLAEAQALKRPRLLARAGLGDLPRTDFRYRNTFSDTGTTVGAPLLAVGAARDIERDLQPGMLSALTVAGTDNRFEVVVAPPGAGKSTFIHRLAFELLKRRYPVCVPGPKLIRDGVDPEAFSALSRGAARLFILVDDIHLQPGINALLHAIVGRDEKITVLGSCSQQAFDMMLRGTGSSNVAPRDLVSLCNIHHLRLTPRETQRLSDVLDVPQVQQPDVTAHQRQAVAAGVRDIQELAVSLRYGLRPGPFALSALEDLDWGCRRALAALCILSPAGRGIPIKDLGPVLGDKLAANLEELQKASLVARYEHTIYPPHEAVAGVLLHAPDLFQHAGDRIELAAKVISGIFGADPLLAERAVRGWLQSGDRDFGRRLWARVRHLWLDGMGEATPTGVIEGIVPLLTLGGDYRMAADLCRGYLEHPHVGSRAGFQLGLNLYQMAGHRAAGTQFDAHIAGGPERSAALLNRALTDIGRADYGSAMAHLEVLEREQERLPGLQYLLGYLAELQGHVERAVTYYREARAQYGYDSAALQRLAALKMATGAAKDAIRLYEAGLQQDPDNVEYYGGLAVAHHSGDNPSRAIVQSSRAIQAGIDPAIARKSVARAYMEYGLYDQALGELSNSLTYAPADTEAKVLVARCLRSRGNLQRAIETLREAAVGAPHSIDIKYELALCLRNAEDYAAAEEIISGVLGAPEAPPRVYLLAATISANQGDPRRQAERAALAIEAGDETGWGWFISARAVAPDQAGSSYETAANYLAQTAQAAPRTESASALAGVAACRRALGSHQDAAKAATEARKKLAAHHYGGEPVFSPHLLRGIPGTEFIEELKDYEQ